MCANARLCSSLTFISEVATDVLPIEVLRNLLLIRLKLLNFQGNICSTLKTIALCLLWQTSCIFLSTNQFVFILMTEGER